MQHPQMRPDGSSQIHLALFCSLRIHPQVVCHPKDRCLGRDRPRNSCHTQRTRRQPEYTTQPLS
jgi:hypothetical protein